MTHDESDPIVEIAKCDWITYPRMVPMVPTGSRLVREWVLSAVPPLDDLLTNSLLFVKEQIVRIRSSIWRIRARLRGGLCGQCWESVHCYMMIYTITLPLSSSHQNEQHLFQRPYWRAWPWRVSLRELTSFHFSKSVVLQMASAWRTLIQMSHESWDRREVIYWRHCWDGIAALGLKGEHSASWPSVPGSWTRGWLTTRWALFDCPSPCLQSRMSSGKVLLFIVSTNHICDDSDLPSSSSAKLSAWCSGSACGRFLDLWGAGAEMDFFWREQRLPIGPWTQERYDRSRYQRRTRLFGHQ